MADVEIKERDGDMSIVICGMARKIDKTKQLEAVADADAELIACYKMYNGDDPKTFTAYTIEVERLRLKRKK